jgi:hypothetical protein
MFARKFQLIWCSRTKEDSHLRLSLQMSLAYVADIRSYVPNHIRALGQSKRSEIGLLPQITKK